MPKAAVIFNARAHNAPPLDRLQRACAALEPQGWEIAIRATEAPLHAVALARAAAEAGASVVFACGGDGTINEVVNGIAGTAAALAVVRGGTGDVFAKEAGVPRDIAAALAVLTRGEERLIDVGLAAGRRFLLMAGAGFDGSVVRRVPDRPKRLLGTTSYVIWGAAEALRFRSRPVDLRLDDAELRSDLFWLLLGNTRSYGGVVNVAREAVADDGLLDGYVFAGKGLCWMLSTGARIALGRHGQAPGVTFRRLRSLEVLTPGLDVQADGEYFGQTPMAFAVEPRALRVLLPTEGGSHLFSAPPLSARR